jgi:8-oxo-dGTP pyrophosphatase MutT (NUDIX family)
VTSYTCHPAGSIGPAVELAVARQAVADAAPGDPSHEAHRREILEFIDRHPDALHRSCEVGHLTGSAAVVDPSTRHVLLLFHAKVRRWLQPGGHADGDADLAHVALREAEEETGIAGLSVVRPAIDLDVHRFEHAAGLEPDHLHLDVRHLVLAPPGAEPAGNHESEGMAWVAEGDLDRYDVDPGTTRMMAAALRALDEL